MTAYKFVPSSLTRPEMGSVPISTNAGYTEMYQHYSEIRQMLMVWNVRAINIALKKNKTSKKKKWSGLN